MSNIKARNYLSERIPRLILKSRYQTEIHSSFGQIASRLVKTKYLPSESGVRVWEVITHENEEMFFCVQTLGPRLTAWLVGDIETTTNGKLILRHEIGVNGWLHLLFIFVGVPIMSFLFGSLSFPIQLESLGITAFVQVVALLVYFFYALELKTRLHDYIENFVISDLDNYPYENMKLR